MKRLNKDEIDGFSNFLKDNMNFVQTLCDKKASLEKAIGITVLDTVKLKELNINTMLHKEASDVIKKIIWEMLNNKERFKRQHIMNLKDGALIEFIRNIKKYNQKIFVNTYSQDPQIDFITSLYQNMDVIRLDENKSMENLAKKCRESMSDGMSKLIDAVSNLIRVMESEEGRLAYKQHIINPMIQQKESLENAKTTLFESGWILRNTYIEPIKEEVVERKKDKEMLDKYLLEYIDNNFIDNTLSQWKTMEVLSRRIHIVEECIISLRNECYYTFMCTMFAQLEGVIVDVFYNYTPKDGNYKSDFIRESIQYTVGHDEDVDEQLIKFYSDVVLGKFELGEDVKPLNRNSVLHGYNTQYGSRANAYKLFMLFECIVQSLDKLI